MIENRKRIDGHGKRTNAKEVKATGKEYIMVYYKLIECYNTI